MIELNGRDIFYSIILHLGLLMTITFLKPFTVRTHRDFDAITVNVISLPPKGDLDLLKGKELQAQVPQALKKDEQAVPLATPESKAKAKKAEKKEKQAKPKKDTQYKGNAALSDKSQTGGTDVSDQLGPGSPFGTVSIDNANFNYPIYFVQAFSEIQRNWSNPVAANTPLSCVIYFQVIRSGTVLDPVIEKSSNILAFDRACLRAVQASDPLPPLPSDFSDDIIGIHLEFPYQP